MTLPLKNLILFLIPVFVIAAVISDHKPAKAPPKGSNEKVLFRDHASQHHGMRLGGKLYGSEAKGS